MEPSNEKRRTDMAKTKVNAIVTIMRDARADRVTTTSARRVVKACKALGCDSTETVRVLSWLDYCDHEGNPYSTIDRVW